MRWLGGWRAGLLTFEKEGIQGKNIFFAELLVCVCNNTDKQNIFQFLIWKRGVRG